MRLVGIALILRLSRWLLPVIVGVAFALSTAHPSGSLATAEAVTHGYSQAIAADGHAMPAHKCPEDLKGHPCCQTGAGCMAFTLIENCPPTDVPATQIVHGALISVLATRLIAPPLPPPISLVFA